MPTYEYVCRECGQHLEVFQSFRDEALTTCNSCQGQLRKVFSPAGILFKGSGFYVTDTRAERDAAKSGSSKSDGSSSSKSSSDSSGSSSSDSGGDSGSDSGSGSKSDSGSTGDSGSKSGSDSGSGSSGSDSESAA